MRRDEAPFIFPVTNDPELEGCDDLLRARRRGFALVRYQPHYLTTLIRMRTPFLEKQNAKKRKGARTSPDFSSPALTRSELKKRQRRAENRRNDEGIHDVLNLEPLWREKRDDDTIEVQADDESDSIERPRIERRRTRSSARADQSNIVQVEELNFVNSEQVLAPRADKTRRHSTSTSRKRPHSPDELQLQKTKDSPSSTRNKF